MARLEVARRLYQALTAQDPDRLITLRDGGGRVVVEGTPETVAKTRDSYTGQFLEPLLDG